MYVRSELMNPLKKLPQIMTDELVRTTKRFELLLQVLHNLQDFAKVKKGSFLWVGGRGVNDRISIPLKAPPPQSLFPF